MTDALSKLQLYVGDEVGQELYNEVRAEDATLRTRIAELEAALEEKNEFIKDGMAVRELMDTDHSVHFDEDAGAPIQIECYRGNALFAGMVCGDTLHEAVEKIEQ